MILLLSSSDDANFDFVVEWLEFYEHPYLRINSDDPLLSALELTVSPRGLRLRGETVNLDEVGAIWLRQFGNLRRSPYWPDLNRNARHDLVDQLVREHAALLNGLVALLSDKYWLTPPSRAHVNKLDMLMRANAAGLRVPETHVVNRKQALRELIADGDYISKSLYEPMFVQGEGGLYSMFTTQVDVADLDSLPDEFAPSLVQRLVRKRYELRVFYLDGDCHAMAIFSQQRERTRLDFRSVDWTDPPRQVPYSLPDELVAAIRRFMIGIGLNCGSLDLIRSDDGEFYFLEVNPAGQFGMVAFPCNYPLYQQIALHLIDHDKA